MHQTMHPARSEESLSAVSLASAFGAGSEFSLVLPTQGTPYITWQTVFSAAPDSVTVNLEASLDGTNWFVVDSSTAVAGEIRSLTGSYRFLRANNSAVANGAGKTLTVTLVYTNKQSPNVPLELKKLVRVLTAAQVKSLFTVPIEIFPAKSGIFYYLRVWSFIKNTTVAFVGGTGQNLRMVYQSSPVGPQSVSATFLDGTTITGRIADLGASSLIGEAVAELGGKAIKLDLSGADLTGTGSTCTLTVYYYEYPSAV